jgi:hypothetical protein
VTALYQALLGFAPPASILNPLVNLLNSGTLTRTSLVQQTVTGSGGTFYLQRVVVADLYKYMPDASKGDLPVRLGATGPIDNPNPATVSLYTNQLVNGQNTQDGVLVSLMTSPQYLKDAGYLRGIYVSPGIRI